jgi:hypothetical protein|nr:H195 [uncultured bacterium]
MSSNRNKASRRQTWRGRHLAFLASLALIAIPVVAKAWPV